MEKRQSDRIAEKETIIEPSFAFRGGFTERASGCGRGREWADNEAGGGGTQRGREICGGGTRKYRALCCWLGGVSLTV